MSAKKKSASKSGNKKTTTEELELAVLIPDEEHPDYCPGSISGDYGEDCESSWNPENDPSGEADGSEELGSFPSIPGPIPHPLPVQPGPIIPRPIFPRFCGPVSGTYRSGGRRRPPFAHPISIHPRPVVPRWIPGPIFPINLFKLTVRVDVDRYHPQERISVEATRLFPNQKSHIIAEVTSDRCSGWRNRVIRANIVYRDGVNSMLPGTEIVFTARRTRGFGYGAYQIELRGGGISPKRYDLSYTSRYFDPVEFEVDRVSNAGNIVTSYATGSHPNRPAGLPSETITLASVYKRAGFDAKMSPNSSVIPTSGAGANGTWSDAEMHNAMVTYWSRFANRPQWAMWILYAARHDSGRGLGGIMFDDIGSNHRQGTAIFTDSFIQDAPAGDPNAPAWRRRMEFWTAVHEMGHGFNLAHAWQKSLGNPWLPLANEPESRSFMNYPFNVSGGQASFFSDFRFGFSDQELIFMRHAPRRFVQMGNSSWFVNHGFEAPDETNHTGNWDLVVRPNRGSNTYKFLEPVTMELKLSNTSEASSAIEQDLLEDGRHITVFIQREGGEPKQWRSLMTHCHEPHADSLNPGESIYGAHNISVSTEGWLIDEPGFYKIQAAIDLTDEIVVSNVLRLYVAPPNQDAEANIATDYFSEDVGRVLAFQGAPALDSAEKILETVVETCSENPAAKHARIALSTPKLRNFKILEADGGREDLAIKTQVSKVSAAAKIQGAALLKDPNVAADTLGHIPYFETLRKAAEALEESGAEAEAIKMMTKTIKVMKDRNILASVIDNAERRLKRRKD